MHTFIYPKQNSYITNESGYENKNFSLDSILEIKSINTLDKVYNYYVTQSISSSISESCGKIYGFTGRLDGNISGIATYSETYISGTAVISTNVYNGYYNGGTLIAYSGSLSGSVSGSISGSLSGSSIYITGNIVGFTGSLVGHLVGTQSIYQPYITYTPVPVASRALMKFDLTEISKSISSGDIDLSSLKFSLNLKAANAKELPLKYNIIAYPLLQDWNIGTGRYQLGGSDDGVSWNYSDFNGGTSWTLEGSYFNSSSLYSGSQQFNHNDSDVRMDVSNMALGWINGNIVNDGMMLWTSLESSSQFTNNLLQFFSTETNTIYSPYLDVYWDDSVYTTGSLNSIESFRAFNLIVQDLLPEYKFGSIVRVNVFARDKYPLKNFVKSTQFSQFTTSSCVTTKTYYSIKDNESEEIFIDFDEGSKLSCDGNINYFLFDTTGLAQERYYKILLKTVLSDGRIDIIDNGNVFKIVR
jgi:hypothetical protein